MTVFIPWFIYDEYTPETFLGVYSTHAKAAARGAAYLSKTFEQPIEVAEALAVHGKSLRIDECEVDSASCEGE